MENEPIFSSKTTRRLAAPFGDEPRGRDPRHGSDEDIRSGYFLHHVQQEPCRLVNLVILRFDLPNDSFDNSNPSSSELLLRINVQSSLC